MPDDRSSSETFDYIVVGAGSAGCILANRLTADGRHRVLLLEAGGEDRSIWTKIPVGYSRTIGNPAFDWCFETAEEPELNNRKIPHPRGKMMGGSSSINGLFQVRGQAGDFDHWRQLGLEGWGWDLVLPYFKKHEDFAPGANAYHGTGGELGVVAATRLVACARRHQARRQGRRPAELDDFNTGDNEGVGPYHVIIRNGVRSSTARAFLKPARSRGNLKVETRALAQRILFDGRRAVGVTYRQGDAIETARATREVIVSTGAIKTPQLLLVSGRRPGALLAEHGIPVVLDKPGVGENLQDHLQMIMTYRLEGIETLNQDYNAPFGRARMALQYALFRTGPMSTGPSPLGMFVRTEQPVRSRQHCVHRAAILARRARHEERVPSLSRPHDVRLRLPADQPRHHQAQGRRHGRTARHPLQLSFDRTGPPRRHRRDAHHAPPDAAACPRPAQADRTASGQGRGRRRRFAARRLSPKRDDDLSSRSAPPRWAGATMRWLSSMRGSR